MKCSRWLMAVSSLALALGCADTDRPECVQICQAADSCGMLPSPLGVADHEGLIKYSALDNCEVRCANSSGRTIQQLTACIDRVSTSTHTDPWCADGCSEVANCFEQVFEDPRITGSGRVQVEFTSASDRLINSALTCAKQAEVPDADDLDVETLCGTAEDVTTSPVIERVEVLLENGEDAQVLISGTCSEVLASSFTSDLVAVGRYQLAIRLYRTEPSQSGGTTTQTCHKFYGDNVLVSAGADVCADGLCLGKIPLPTELTGDFQDVACMDLGVSQLTTGFACENDVETCTNTKDDDCDQLSDCNDPSCAALCGESGTDCTDQLDNDGDALTDCDDPDCEAQCSSTTETESGSDSGSDSGTGG